MAKTFPISNIQGVDKALRIVANSSRLVAGAQLDQRSVHVEYSSAGSDVQRSHNAGLSGGKQPAYQWIAPLAANSNTAQ